MQVFDASSMIYAWDNYPPEQFPPLWNWLAKQVGSGEIVLSVVAYEEVVHKLPECAEWLATSGVQKVAITNAILAEATKIKSALGIIGDKFHPKGVDENDLLIIATAKSLSISLVSNESAQKLPDVPAKRKIPAVCGMPDVSVSCKNFVAYLKASGATFGDR
jgi:predicted nucleic acid-binding protein